MNAEEKRLKWYIVLFAQWLADKSEGERFHILNNTDQPAMLALFEHETTLPPGNIIHCNSCNHMFVTKDHPRYQCPHCKARF